MYCKVSHCSIRIDLARSLQLAEELERLINQTNRAIALVQQAATKAPPSRQLISPSYQTYGDEGGLAGINRH